MTHRVVPHTADTSSSSRNASKIFLQPLHREGEYSSPSSSDESVYETTQENTGKRFTENSLPSSGIVERNIPSAARNISPLLHKIIWKDSTGAHARAQGVACHRGLHPNGGEIRSYFATSSCVSIVCQALASLRRRVDAVFRRYFPRAHDRWFYFNLRRQATRRRRHGAVPICLQDVPLCDCLSVAEVRAVFAHLESQRNIEGVVDSSEVLDSMRHLHVFPNANLGLVLGHVCEWARDPEVDGEDDQWVDEDCFVRIFRTFCFLFHGNALPSEPRH